MAATPTDRIAIHFWLIPLVALLAALLLGKSGDWATGAALAVFLFLLVIPVLALNIRRFKRDV